MDKETAGPSTTLRSGRDDKGEGSASINRRRAEKRGRFVSAYLATTIYGSAALPLVIPSAAEGSAVRPGSRTKVWVVSSHTDSTVLGNSQSSLRD